MKMIKMLIQSRPIANNFN